MEYFESQNIFYVQDALILVRKQFLEIASKLKVNIPVKASLGKVTAAQIASYLNDIKVT